MKKKYNLRKGRLLNILLGCLLILFSFTSMAQNLNFTIDSAVDSGTDITETISNGDDTFVLTVDHATNIEELDNLGGGDLIFFLGTDFGDSPWFLTITKNGIPTNFDLNGIDYDTLGAGSIGLSNQDDAVITTLTAFPVGFGALPISSPTNAAGITQIKIIPGDADDFNDFGFHNINVTIVAPCVPPAGTVTFVSQDCGVGQFFAEVNVTNLGGGSPSIFDGTSTLAVTAIGVYNFGPYSTGTPINFILQQGIDMACDINLGTVVDTCPPPCLSPVGTATLSSQDCAAETFFIDVNITNLGSGSPIIFDGTTSTPVATTGLITLGPYPTGTSIPIIVQHGNDATCNLVLGNVGDTCSELIFTIDTAVDNVTDLTETITIDGDTFVLTVDHPGSETLDQLTSDWVFYLGSGGANTIEPFVLTITKNGFPTNFTLKGMDYDTSEAGIISITNQDDELISNALYPIGMGAINIGNTSNTFNIASFNIIPGDADDLNYFGFDNIKVDIIDSCASGAATAIISGQDCITDEFFVDIDVTDLGNGSPVIFDGTTSTPVAVIGVMNLGPYPTGIPISFTLQHGSDSACDVDLGTITDTCPPAPVNDECTGAIAIACGETVTGTTSDATDSGNNPSTDVFYSFADTVLQDVSLSLCNSDYDTFIRVFDDCPQSNQIAGNDDSVDCLGNQSEVTFTAQPNVTYYIMIEGYDNEFGDFELTIDCIPNVPAPGNDLCANPTALTLAATVTGETTAGATDSTIGEDDDTDCQPYTFKSDVWYTFVAPSSGEVTVETATSGASTAASIALYPNCGQLDTESLGCVVGDTTGAILAVTGLVSGATYYIRVWSDGVAARNSQRIEGAFNIIVSDTVTLSTTDLDSDTAFSYYPNPVNTMLTLSSKKEISNVIVFNMIGQEVYTEIANSLKVNLDMSNLQSGAYFVKITMDNVTKTIRVIKE